MQTMAESSASRMCAICFENVLDADAAVTPCAHVFHTICLSKWTTQQNQYRSPSCPVCRTTLPRDEAAEQAEMEALAERLSDVVDRYVNFQNAHDVLYGHLAPTRTPDPLTGAEVGLSPTRDERARRANTLRAASIAGEYVARARGGRRPPPHYNAELMGAVAQAVPSTRVPTVNSPGHLPLDPPPAPAPARAETVELGFGYVLRRTVGPTFMTPDRRPQLPSGTITGQIARYLRR